MATSKGKNGWEILLRVQGRTDFVRHLRWLLSGVGGEVPCHADSHRLLGVKSPKQKSHVAWGTVALTCRRTRWRFSQHLIHPHRDHESPCSATCSVRAHGHLIWTRRSNIFSEMGHLTSGQRGGPSRLRVCRARWSECVRAEGIP